MTVHRPELHNDFPLTFSHSLHVCSLGTCQCLMTLLAMNPLILMVSPCHPPTHTFYHSSSSHSSLSRLPSTYAPTSLLLWTFLPTPPMSHLLHSHPLSLLLTHSSLRNEDIYLLSCPLLKWSSLDIFSKMWLLTF